MYDLDNANIKKIINDYQKIILTFFQVDLEGIEPCAITCHANGLATARFQTQHTQNALFRGHN